MPPAAASELAEQLVVGDLRALARAITLVENGDAVGHEVLKAVYASTGRARMLGLTGPPGVGKSTLIGAMIGQLRARDERVAVLSIDPSSPFTHGALLGDRIRLADHFLDSGVYIRSMASRGALGGLSEATLQAALLMDASGHDNVLIETVGVGQAEVDVIHHADTIVLALMPGSGDSVQALKAGVMEIPDVIVVNKADHPMTDTLVREIKSVLALSDPVEGWATPVVCTRAVDGVGVDELIAAVDAHREHLEEHGGLAERRRRNLQSEVMELATNSLRRDLEREVSRDPEAQQLIEQVVQRRLDPGSAARELLRRRERN
jgi:LAO/AO transport system kinase